MAADADEVVVMEVPFLKPFFRNRIVSIMHRADREKSGSDPSFIPRLSRRDCFVFVSGFGDFDFGGFDFDGTTFLAEEGSLSDENDKTLLLVLHRRFEFEFEFDMVLRDEVFLFLSLRWVVGSGGSQEESFPLPPLPGGSCSGVTTVVRFRFRCLWLWLFEPSLLLEANVWSSVVAFGFGIVAGWLLMLSLHRSQRRWRRR